MITEAGLQHHLVIPGIAEFARGGLPDPPATDDGNHWVDGLCWLYCGQQSTRVLWIGPASVAGAQAPMYACGPCIQELQQRVWRSLLLDDEPARTASRVVPVEAASPAGRRGGRHRRP
ncbi:hypothetical protein [Streptomyces sp. TRM49041]|uniref:hypothetical protein n=1 Tax=Streptomyces sp. TRM49041 TaxID=2603216 RepID=UPI0011EE254A|nr:hypothetical protein [Streptomyces sp. TRM49041]